MEEVSATPKIKFFAAIKNAILNIKDYKGRSRRSEYFYWLLTVVLSSIIIGVIVGLIMELISVLGEIILTLFLIEASLLTLLSILIFIFYLLILFKNYYFFINDF